MHALILLPVVLPETHHRLIVWLRERKAILAHDRAENAVDLAEREAEMLRCRELKQNVMHQRCVDVAGCVGSPDPHSKNLSLRTASIPSVTL